jgi:succinate dehydrogenase/fumarate reductase flavoprotein subunit
MAAALFASIWDQKVLLIERTDRVGGTTALSAGTAWVPNTHHARAIGADDNPEKAAHYLKLAVGNRSSDDLQRAFLANGPAAIALLESSSEVKFRPFNLHPDYLTELDGSVMFGRAIEPLPFDGRVLGNRFALLRDPIPEFTILNGMMVDRSDVFHLLNATSSWSSAWSASKLLSRHLIDRLKHTRGTRLVMGNALCGRLLQSLDQRGVPIWLDAKVEELTREGDRISGAIVLHDGVKKRVTTRRGVVLASGGFSRHPKLRSLLLNDPVPTESPISPGNTGEMHDLALAIGARHGVDNLDAAVWAPVSVRRRADGSTAVYPHFFLDRGKPGVIAVNKAGRRFVTEATSYHLFGRSMFELNDGVPSIPAFLITDSIGLHKYGLGIVKPGRRGLEDCLKDGYVVAAASIQELATKMQIDASNLKVTISAMNSYAKMGVDLEFNRGGTAYERTTNGDSTHGPNPCLGTISAAPFFAVRIYPGDIGAATGLVTNDHAQVIGNDDLPIQGLFACGNDMNSVMGGTYPGPGINIGPALTFAFIAAHFASHTPPHL